MARLTREGRADPVRKQILVEGLQDLAIEDPENRLAVWLASYSTDAILRGLATFKAKKELGTIPNGADPGRYLGGIIRNLHVKREQELIGDHLLELRLRQRELSLAPLAIKEEELRATRDAAELPQCFVDNALESSPLIDFRFWMNNAKTAMADLCTPLAKAVYHHLVRRIACSFATARERREDLLDALAAAFTLAPG